MNFRLLCNRFSLTARHPIASFSLLLGTLLFCSCGSPPSSSDQSSQDQATQALNLGDAIPVQSISQQSNTQQATQLKHESSIASAPHLSAEQVWLRMAEQLRQAKSYVDQAEWNLQYRIDGQLYVETQPVSLKFDRQSSRWSATGFRTQLLNDGRYTTVKINEVATNNLDQQIKVVESQNWTAVFDDPIAQVYLSGATDFPLNDKTFGWPALFFPQLSLLLQNQTPVNYFSDAKWEDAGSGVYNQRNCRIIRQGRAGNQIELWVDTETNLPKRLFVPNDVLDYDLRQTPNVYDLRLSIDFATIQLNQPVQVADFQASSQHKLVQQFVKVPEAFPSSYIGKPSPQISWTLAGTDQTWSLNQYAGRTVLAVFLPGDNAFPAWANSILAAQKSRAFDSAEYLLVPVPFSQDLSPIVDQIPPAKLKVIADGTAVWSELGLQNQPMLVAWDGHGIVQYAAQTSLESVAKQSINCVQQLSAGQSVAADMIADYRSFYEKYQHRLKQVACRDLPANYQAPTVTPKTIPNTNLAERPLEAHTDSFDDRPLNIELDRGPNTAAAHKAATSQDVIASETASTGSFRAVWEAQLQLPQSAVWTSGQELWVLDGFQTLQKFSFDGKTKQSVQLALPEGTGVSQIRIHQPTESIVAFQPGDRQLFVFDATGQLRSQTQMQDAIVDLQVIAKDEDSAFQILISLQNQHVRLFENQDLRQPLQFWPIGNVSQLWANSTTPLNLEQATVAAVAAVEDGQVVRLHSNGTATSISPPRSNGADDIATPIDNGGSHLLLTSIKSAKAGIWSPNQANRIIPIDLDSEWLRQAAEGNLSVLRTDNGYLFYAAKRYCFVALDGRRTVSANASAPILFITVSASKSAGSVVAMGTKDGNFVAFETTSRVSQNQGEHHR